MVRSSGAVTDRPWGVTLAGLGIQGFTGLLTMTADGKDYSISFDLGRIVGATSPLASDAAVRMALTNHLISSSQATELNRQIVAAKDRDELEVLAGLAGLTPDHIDKLRHRLVAQRAARTFSLDNGTYVADERIAMPPGADLDAREVIYQGARMNLSEQRLALAVRTFGSVFTIKPDALPSLEHFGFGVDEKPVLGSLRAGASLPQLEAAHRDLDPRMVQAIVYALMSCGTCDAERSSTSGDVVEYASGPEATSRPTPPPQGATYFVSRAPTNPMISRAPTNPGEPSDPVELPSRTEIPNPPRATRAVTELGSGSRSPSRPVDDGVARIPPSSSRTQTGGPPGQPATSRTPPGQSATSRAQTSDPAGSRTQTSDPAGSRTQTGQPDSSRTQTSAPAGSRTQTSAPAGSRTQTSAPAGSRTWTGQPDSSRTQTSDPAGSRTQTGQPGTSRTQTGQPASSRTQTGGPPGQPDTSRTWTGQPDSSRVQTSDPAGSRTQTSDPAGSRTQGGRPATSRAQASEPTGSRTQGGRPATSRAQTSDPASSGTQTGRPATSRAETSEPAMSRTETGEPIISLPPSSDPTGFRGDPVVPRTTTPRPGANPALRAPGQPTIPRGARGGRFDDPRGSDAGNQSTQPASILGRTQTGPVLGRTQTGPVPGRTQTSDPAVARTASGRPSAGRTQTSDPVVARTASGPPAGPAIARTSTARRTQALIAARMILVEQAADYFTLLGVPFDAPIDVIQTAYLNLVRQLHPDKLEEIGVPDLSGNAQRVFHQVGLAFSVLTDPVRRAAYLEKLGKPSATVELTSRTRTADDIPQTPAGDAYRRGESALRRDEPVEAVIEFGRACALEPNNVDFHAMLGWAQFCAARDKVTIAPETRKALDRAVQRSAKPTQARFLLGRVERMLGRDREALRHFQEVVETSAQHPDAAAEIRAIEARLARSPGKR